MNRKPLLLDLFCGAGGCAMGYARAGFEVVGVDHKPQPRYPFWFVQADSFDFLASIQGGDYFGGYTMGQFDAIHASPPCQGYSRLRHVCPGRAYPMVIPHLRKVLMQSGLLFVIENVIGAPLENAVRLCGSSFGLGVRRHRLFESNFDMQGSKCNHKAQGQPVCVAGSGGRRINRRKDDHGGAVNFPANIANARKVMGIEWMTRSELSQAVPPAYTEFIGKQLMRVLE